MARIGLPRIDAAGVYVWLLKREEAAAASAGGVLSGQFGGEGPWVYRHVPDRLEALRAGRPVNVPSGSLPGWARTGAPTRKSRRRLTVTKPARAIVRPDDTITWSDDDWARLWLEEAGL
jgi:hypothetical protein